jgi:hypothetical protein
MVRPIEMTRPTGVALLYNLAPKEPVRLVADVSGTKRTLLWLMVGKDASVYLGIPRATKWAKRGAKASTGAPVEVKYSEGEFVTDLQLLKSLHLSFHPSGIINAAGGRCTIPSWRQIKAVRQLCLVLFEAMEAYRPIAGLRKRDIEFGYSPNPARSVVARVLVAPPGSPIVVDSSAQVEFVVGFDITGAVGELEAFRLQVSLTDAPSTNRPPATYVVWAAERSNIGLQPTAAVQS